MSGNYLVGGGCSKLAPFVYMYGGCFRNNDFAGIGITIVAGIRVRMIPIRVIIVRD